MQQIIDLTSHREKNILLQMIRNLQGMYRVEIVKHRKRRSDRQNRFYWPMIVVPFADYLRGQGHDFTDEMAHEVLKKMFLESTIIDKETGEAFTYVRSTTELSTVEFNDYLDRCAQVLAEHGVIVPEAGDYHEPITEAECTPSSPARSRETITAGK